MVLNSFDSKAMHHQTMHYLMVNAIPIRFTSKWLLKEFPELKFLALVACLVGLDLRIIQSMMTKILVVITQTCFNEPNVKEPQN